MLPRNNQVPEDCKMNDDAHLKNLRLIKKKGIGEFIRVSETGKLTALTCENRGK